MTTQYIPDSVKREANDHLDFIEDEYGVTVVFAVAHGSHAWGLSNEASDYDIKVVYTAPDLHRYAHLGSHRETITREFGEFEIEAWDVKKFAELLYKSNDQAVDVLRSPIAYRERIPRDDLRAYITDAYNPIQLYHTYRSIAKNNYRKYLSHHLVSNRDDVYPILTKFTNESVTGYVVLNEHTGEEVKVPGRAVDNETGDDRFIELPFDAVDTSQDDHRYCPNCDRYPETIPVTFETTQTRQTVKRNLAVIRASMNARYVKRTGERDGMERELPHVDFTTFLTEQAPAVFSKEIVLTAWDVVNKKLDGNTGEIGDIVGREFAHPPEYIDPDVHAESGPDQSRLNTAISELLEVTRTDT